MRTFKSQLIRGDPKNVNEPKMSLRDLMHDDNGHNDKIGRTGA